MEKEKSKPTANNAPKKPDLHRHHYIRTPIASFLGFMAVILILGSIFAVWLNRTLTDTPTFVTTVSPLVEKPEVQKFVAQKTAEGFVENLPIKELSQGILTPEQVKNNSPEKAKELAQTEVENRVLEVLQDPTFVKIWKQTTESTHAQMIEQLKAGSENVTLDFSPIIDQVVLKLKKTSLGAAADDINTDKIEAKVTLKRDDLGPAADIYDTLQTSTLALLISAAIALTGCIIISVHHMKTFRRVMMYTGIFSLILYGLLQLPNFVSTSGIDTVSRDAALAVLDSVLVNLKSLLLIIGIGTVVISVGSKIAEKFIRKKDKNSVTTK